MSQSFNHANQFSQAYQPRRLRNWQVPKWYPDKALPRTGKTVVVANDRGHLLPGIPRSKDNPWGNFVGTWNLPIKISRELANEFGAPNKFKVNAYERKLQNFKQQLLEVKKSPAATCVAKCDPCDGPCCCIVCRRRREGTNDEELEKESDKDSGVGDDVQQTKPLCPIHDY